MRILIATPLYPPDCGGAALYTKELAKRLSESHTVRVLHYGHLPEKIEGVKTFSVSKRYPLFLRLPSFFFFLLKEIRHADVLIAENGPSVELPVLFLSHLTSKPIIFHIGDRDAHEYAQKKGGLRKRIEERAFSRAKTTLPQTPISRPEILPFRPHPTEKMTKYEESWKTHLTRLTHLFSYGN